MLDDFFDRIYVLNLPERKDRLAEMTAELAKVGASFDDPNIQLFPASRPSDMGKFPSIGARGCFTSHREMLHDAERNGYQRIMIIEDDLDFAEDFSGKAPAILRALSEHDWSMFYGGYEELTLDAKGLNALAPDQRVQTTHFVCLAGKAIIQAREYLDLLASRDAGHQEGGPMHVDGAYSWFRKHHPALQAFAVSPPLGVQRASRSDIADLKWYDKAPVIKQIAQIARSLIRE